MELNEKLYKGIEVKVEKIVAKDEDVEKEISNLLAQNPNKVSQDRALQEGDTALFDFKGLKDGVAFDGGTAENYELVIGSNQFIPGFESQMVGMNKGEEKDLEVTFPENYGEASLAGQAVIFKVKLHDIFTLEEAKLTDEFVASLTITPSNSVEELRNEIKTFLEEDAKNATNELASNTVLDKLIDSVELEVSEEDIKNVTELEIKQIEMQLAQQGMGLDQYLQMAGMSKEVLEEQIKPNAIKRITLENILKEIVKLENIEVTEKEVDNQYEMISTQYGMPLENVKEAIKAEEIVNQYSMMKATQVVIDNAKISYK